MKEFRKGDIVYVSRNPQSPGKVIGTGEPGYWGETLRVRFINGTVGDVSPRHLKSLAALISDHEKKLAYHRERMERARAIEEAIS